MVEDEELYLRAGRRTGEQASGRTEKGKKGQQHLTFRLFVAARLICRPPPPPPPPQADVINHRRPLLFAIARAARPRRSNLLPQTSPPPPLLLALTRPAPPRQPPTWAAGLSSGPASQSGVPSQRFDRNQFGPTLSARLCLISLLFLPDSGGKTRAGERTSVESRRRRRIQTNDDDDDEHLNDGRCKWTAIDLDLVGSCSSG